MMCWERMKEMLSTAASKGDGVSMYVIPPEQLHMLQEMKKIVDEIIEEILSLYRMMGAAAETPPPTSPAAAVFCRSCDGIIPQVRIV
jgi:hypothetical protein